MVDQKVEMSRNLAGALTDKRDPYTAASGNILESRRRICDGVEHAHGLLSEWWSAHATGLTSVCLHSCPTGLTAGGLEAVPDTIGLVKVDLVGCLSDKSVMGHLGVVLFDVEIDQTPELREACRANAGTTTDDVENARMPRSWNC